MPSGLTRRSAGMWLLLLPEDVEVRRHWGIVTAMLSSLRCPVQVTSAAELKIPYLWQHFDQTSLSDQGYCPRLRLSE